MHALLARQLRKLGLDPDVPALDAAAWHELSERVSRTYAAADQDRYLLERSLALASVEMRELHEHPRAIAEQRYENLFESASDIIFTADLKGRFTAVNRACAELAGCTKDELIGRPWEELFGSDGALATSMQLHTSHGGATSARFEADIDVAGGDRVTFEISLRLVMHDGVARELLGVGRDVSERRQHEADLEYLALHDPLTGLPNRRVLEETLRATVGELLAIGDAVVLGLLDLDDFKLINDTLGHGAGDRVLVSVADMLRESLPGATVVRLSGDEFAFVLRAATPADAMEQAERVRRAIEAAEIDVAGERVFVSASIGLVSVDAASHASGLLAEADAAMYTAKAEGRNRLHWSGSQDVLTGRLAEVQRSAAAVRVALEAGRLEVHYQPVVALYGSRRHYEALVRMRGERGELVPPGMFLPAAERFGLMPTIDRFVLDVVLRRLRDDRWARIFVNVSAATLADRELLATLTQTLRSERGLGRRLGIEITESAALRDTGLARDWIDELGALGCEFALDDFGTGFNSFTYLLQLPVSQIKIDGSFVEGIVTDPRQRAVVAAVQVLANGLGIETVAEHIETPAMLEAVRALGVTYGQGYLLGRPVPELAGQLDAPAADDAAA